MTVDTLEAWCHKRSHRRSGVTVDTLEAWCHKGHIGGVV